MLTWKPRTLAGHAKEGIGAVNYSAAIVRIFLFEQLIKLVELPWVQMRQMWVIAVLRALRIPHRNSTAGFVVLDRVHEAATRLPL